MNVLVPFTERELRNVLSSAGFDSVEVGNKTGFKSFNSTIPASEILLFEIGDCKME